ncbi:ENTH-like protein [Alternaria alternata]|nr:ENTH-like protein [Alternaria alternata]
MAHCLLPRGPWPPSLCSSSPLRSALALASWLHPSPQHTILGLAESRLEVVEREVAHLILQAIEIHGCRLVACRSGNMVM